MIELDGSVGEGGGQILRSALVLSMVTGQPFTITRIRANRPKPGLMRQHLVAVQAAAEICGARVGGAELGSTALSFVPGPIVGGDYTFAIGTAGSCTLVLQTLALALLYAQAPSTVRITGGTHNAMAPPAQFLEHSYGPLLRAMGGQVQFELERHGFYPAGGGSMVATIVPGPGLQPLDLRERGKRLSAHAEATVAGIPANVARRELVCVRDAMGWCDEQLHVRSLSAREGPGNVLLLTLEHAHVMEVFAGFGVKSVTAEAVAAGVVKEVRAYIASGAAVGEHLADQLMLPLALAGGGSFTASSVSQHALTNARVIARFLPVEFGFERDGPRSICVVHAKTSA